MAHPVGLCILAALAAATLAGCASPPSPHTASVPPAPQMAALVPEPLPPEVARGRAKLDAMALAQAGRRTDLAAVPLDGAFQRSAAVGSGRRSVLAALPKPVTDTTRLAVRVPREAPVAVASAAPQLPAQVAKAPEPKPETKSAPEAARPNPLLALLQRLQQLAFAN